jgi:chemotaxis signal transduction protein
VSDGSGRVRAEALRREFDGTFALPVRRGGGDDDDLLAVRVGDTAYAVRLADVTGLAADRPVTPVPTTAPEFLGLVGLRGAVLPVWSLSALLGHGGDRAAPRWLLLAGGRGGTPALALAFEHFDGHLRVRRDQLVDRADEAGAALTHVRQSLRLPGGARGVLALDVVEREIRKRLGLEGTERKPT